ncbi:hypothetical protein Tco_0927943 [Tanacetum coccineum]
MILETDLHCFDVHNDGYFSYLPLAYVNGVILEMAVRRIPYEQFAEFLEEKSGNYFQGLYYQVTNQDLERSLVRVSDDSQAITNEIDACVFKKIGHPKKRYYNEFSIDVMVGWAEMEVEQLGGSSQCLKKPEGVETSTGNIDKGIDATRDGNGAGSGRGGHPHPQTRLPNDDDNGDQSDKSVDYLSPGEEELIEIRNKMKANRDANAKAKDNPVSEMNEPNDENSTPANNVRGETFEKHDIYMNELLKSLKTADKDGIIEDPFIFVEKHVERYPMYDETTHWRLRKLLRVCVVPRSNGMGFPLYTMRATPNDMRLAMLFRYGTRDSGHDQSFDIIAFPKCMFGLARASSTEVVLLGFSFGDPGMDDPNFTIEEYIRLEEEKARKCGKVFNWKTARYGKIWYDEDVHDLRSVETEFPAIVFNDNLTSNETLSYEPTVSSLNDNEIDFRISFDKSDDEDYTVVFDKKSFSYKIISTNDLKTDLENDNEKVNVPLFPSPKPTVSCIDDLDFFKDIKNEFPAIVYNDALTSKSNFSTKPTLCPQHIDEFDMKDETSLSEYDEVEQNILYFNDLFPFNIIYPDNLKSGKGNDDNEIDMIQSSGGQDMAVPPRDQRHQYLRYEGLQYTNADIVDFKTRLARIYRREVHRVQVLDFRGLPNLIAEGLSTRMLMEHRDAQGQSVFTNRAWRWLFDIRGLLVHELILEFFNTRRMSWREFILALGLHSAEEMQTAGFRLYWTESARWIPDKGDMRDYWIGISSVGDFLGIAPSYTFIRDPMLRLCHRLIACSIAGKSQAPKKVLEIICFGEEEGGFDIWRSVLSLKTLRPGYLQDLLGRRGIQDEFLRRLRWHQEVVMRMRRCLILCHHRLGLRTVTSLTRLMDRAGVPYTRYSESPVEYQRCTRQRTGEGNTSAALQQPYP